MQVKVLEPQWSLSAQVLVQQARLMVQVLNCLSHHELHCALAEPVPCPSAHELASQHIYNDHMEADRLPSRQPAAIAP
jgi:hypothetical protein